LYAIARQKLSLQPFEILIMFAGVGCGFAVRLPGADFFRGFQTLHRYIFFQGLHSPESKMIRQAVLF
jgi:hypothetical protein